MTKAGTKTFKMRAKLWLYPGAQAAWHFVYIDKKVSAAIKKMQQGKPRLGWGSVRVRATIGKTSWDTSIFPDKQGPYLLPVKASVRKAEKIGDGDVVALTIALR